MEKTLSSLSPVLSFAVNIYNLVSNFVEEIQDVFEERIDEIEKIIDQIREDFEILNISIVFVEMILGIYEVIRSFLQIFDFVNRFTTALGSLYKLTNVFLVAVDLDPISIDIDET